MSLQAASRWSWLGLLGRTSGAAGRRTACGRDSNWVHGVCPAKATTQFSALDAPDTAAIVRRSTFISVSQPTHDSRMGVESTAHPFNDCSRSAAALPDEHQSISSSSTRRDFASAVGLVEPASIWCGAPIVGGVGHVSGARPGSGSLAVIGGVPSERCPTASSCGSACRRGAGPLAEVTLSPGESRGVVGFEDRRGGVK